VAGQAIRRLAALVMIVAANGCDNVEWGGAELSLQPPPPAEATAGDTMAVASPDQPPPPPLPEGPVLFVGSRSDGRVTLRPLAELREGALSPLPSEADAPGFLEHVRRRLLTPGREFVLFANGARVGTLLADSSFIDADPCGPRVSVSGQAELLLPAAETTRFVALARGDAPDATHEGFVADRTTADAGAVALALASQVIMREQALWPDDLGRARADLHVVPSPDSAGTAVVATFLYRDRLEVEPSSSPAVAYSLFVMGSGRAGGHELAFDWYRRVEEHGKGAVRYFQAADWDGDGVREILLEVLGDSTRWMAALDRDGDRWRQVFEETCTRSVAADSVP
jgi:hypothetical protein